MIDGSSSPTPDRSLTRGLAAVGAAAVVASAAQLARNAWVVHIQGGFSWSTPDQYWATPLAFHLLFGGLGTLLIVLSAAATRETRRAFFVGGLTFVLTVSVLLNVRGLTGWAVASVALGVAVSSGTWALTHMLPKLALRAVWVLGVAVFGVLAAKQRFTPQSSPVREAVPPTGAPNVLLLILDTVRASSMSAFGGTAGTTPVLEALARESTAYERALSPAPWTLPSHASIFTGLPASRLGIQMERPFRHTTPMLAEVMVSGGYATAAFTANPIYTSKEAGFASGFQHYDDFARSLKEVLLGANLMQTPVVRHLLQRELGEALRRLLKLEWRIPPEPFHDFRRAGEIFGQFEAWRTQHSEGPWFAFLNVFDAHGEYVAPADFRGRFPAATPRERDYLGNIAAIDAAIGDLLGRLRADGSLDNTLLIITSDHGEQFGEKGIWGHGNALYMGEIHVPLLIRWPGHIPAGRRVRGAVSLTDLGSEVIALTGVPTPPGSFRHSAVASESDSSVAFSFAQRTDGTWAGPTDRGSLSSIVTGDWHYIRSETGREELFDLAADASEKVNLSVRPVYRSTVDRLRALSDSLR